MTKWDYKGKIFGNTYSKKKINQKIQGQGWPPRETQYKLSSFSAILGAFCSRWYWRIFIFNIKNKVLKYIIISLRNCFENIKYVDSSNPIIIIFLNIVFEYAKMFLNNIITTYVLQFANRYEKEDTKYHLKSEILMHCRYFPRNRIIVLTYWKCNNRK